MADADQTLKILIQLGVIGEKDAQAAKDLLKETSAAGEAMNAGTKKTTEATEEAAAAAEKSGLTHRELKRVLLDIGNIAAPGAGRGLMELAMGPVGVGLALVGVYEMVKKTLEEDAAAADKFAEEISKPTTGGIEGIRKAWDEAAVALGQYYSRMEHAGEDANPEATQIKRIRELVEVQTEASKKIVEALGKEEVARIKAHGGSPEEVAAAEARTKAQTDALESQKVKDTGINLLLKERADITARFSKDQREAEEAQAKLREVNKKFADDEATLKNARALKESETIKALIKAQQDKIEKNSATAADQSPYNNAGRIAAQMNIDEATAEIERLKGLQSRAAALARQLEGSAPARNKTKTDAEEDAKQKSNIAEQDSKRQHELPGEIDQAQKMQSIRDQAEKLANEIATPEGSVLRAAKDIAAYVISKKPVSQGQQQELVDFADLLEQRMSGQKNFHFKNATAAATFITKTFEKNDFTGVWQIIHDAVSAVNNKTDRQQADWQKKFAALQAQIRGGGGQVP